MKIDFENRQVPEEMARECIAEPTCFDDGGRGVETAVQNEVFFFFFITLKPRVE